MATARTIGSFVAAVALCACATQSVENVSAIAGQNAALIGDLITGEWYFGEEEYGSRYLRGVGYAADGDTIVSLRCEPATGQIDIFHDIGPVTTTSSTLRIITAAGVIDVAMRPHDISGWVGSLHGDDPRLHILATSQGRFAIEHDGVVQRLPWDGPLSGILLDCDA